MTATEQTLPATAPEAARAAPTAAKEDQPVASGTLPAPAIPVAPTAAGKTSAKRVVKRPARKVAEAVKATAVFAVKPAVKSVARKSPAAAKPVPQTAATVATASTTPAARRTAAKKTAAKPLANPFVKTAATVAPRVAIKTPVKAQPKAVIAALAKPKVDKLLKAKKPKLVRDSFTIPKLEYLILEELKQRSSILGNSIKKSELIRAGIKALAAMADVNFLAALKAVPAIKTGRPAKD